MNYAWEGIWSCNVQVVEVINPLSDKNYELWVYNSLNMFTIVWCWKVLTRWRRSVNSFLSLRDQMSSTLLCSHLWFWQAVYSADTQIRMCDNRFDAGLNGSFWSRRRWCDTIFYFVSCLGHFDGLFRFLCRRRRFSRRLYFLGRGGDYCWRCCHVAFVLTLEMPVLVFLDKIASQNLADHSRHNFVFPNVGQRRQISFTRCCCFVCLRLRW